MPWFHPSGGLIYHLRAWRYSQGLWRPFHQQLHRWLQGWQPPEQHLVLLGPSGGYALSPAFLGRFTRITLVEPDSLARYILRRRFPHVRFETDSTYDLTGNQGFAALGQRFPDAAFLFCNLLGQQLQGQDRNQDRAAWLSRLEPGLSGRHWASWHDLASAHRPPDEMSPYSLEAAVALEDVLGHFWHGGVLNINDHTCAGIAPRVPRKYAIWPLLPSQYHLVEWLESP